VHQLNPHQRRAVRHVASPLLVLAGAGSGKTGVITHKIAWLIREGGLDPRHIAAVTFTNKAAREMRKRVSGLLGKGEGRGLTLSTFHSLGLRIIRRELDALGYKKGFSIFDNEDSSQLIRELMRSELSVDNGLASQVQYRISSWKNAHVLPSQAAMLCGDDAIAQAAARVYEPYQRQMKACNAMDLDDLILLPTQLLQENPQIAGAWRERIRYLLVDEYQDTNVTQYGLVKALVGERASLTVVGDDDQSIYAWRGAQPENLLQLKQDFPKLEVIKLEQNYRSSGRILKVANALIAHNPHIFEKSLWSELGHGDPIRVMRVANEEHEAERVVSTLLHHRFSKAASYGDYAILYRGNHQSRVFEKVLREHRIPYFLSGETSFFDRSEVKDVMAYLRLAVNPSDDNAFLRIINTPRRGIGPASLEKLSRYAGPMDEGLLRAGLSSGFYAQLATQQAAAIRQFSTWITQVAEKVADVNPTELAQELVTESGYEGWLRETTEDEKGFERRWGNVLELLNWLRRLYDKDRTRTLADLVADISLADIMERNAKEGVGDQVALMTLHAAKGLEFPHVFIVGMEEGLLPHRTSVEEDSLEEERRLFYVGITRAMKTLTLSMAAKRRRFGDNIDCEPSRFLKELPQDDLQWEGGDQNLDPEEKKQRARDHIESIRAMLSS